jgi:23S rRNA (cytidine1920-2'-O)/16S rRNA (cytidine1409-2'-O)-methyltransferase
MIRRRSAPAPDRGARLDERVVREGLAETRARAQAAVLAGRVTVDGAVSDKPGRRVTSAMRVALLAPAHPYVGRGGVKLAHALDVFGVDVRGAVAVDLGASTGGFTDCLLQHAVAKVYAVDVGRGQLAWRLRHDPRVVVMEETNARTLSPEPFGTPADLVTADLSFISLDLVWAAIARLVRPGGRVVALVKPQFEAGRDTVGRGGVVRDPAVHAAVLEKALAGASREGLRAEGVAASPVAGPAGNIEYFVCLRRPSGSPGGGVERDAGPRSERASLDIEGVVADAHARLGRPSRARPASSAAGPESAGRGRGGRGA